MKKLEKILRDLCAAAYWYAENTGDYEMENLYENPFFIATVQKLKKGYRKP